jgi:mannose/cellobiose epimerase-like protein (N-acyl-D-glucosamine 2-epimerase family)
MNPTPARPPTASIVPCGIDCAYATLLRDPAGGWVRCAQPDRERYVAPEDCDCSCFRPRSPSPATLPAS